MSRVRACRLVGLNRSSLNYWPRRPDDSAVRERLRELAAERHRFGYRRLGWLLAREDHGMNRKTPYRIYREQKVIVRRRGRHKRPSARALRSLCPIQAIDGGRSTSYRTHRK
jgi:putative transposase